jgi:DNA (cytosine-5)-methyltransferase 1
MERTIRFLDLFAGAGGLSEGFVKAGFFPLAHVEMDSAACYTLKTRSAYHWLINNNQINTYNNYLIGRITRDDMYAAVPRELLDSVINATISEGTINSIFNQIDMKLSGNNLDLIVGGPPCQAYSLIGRSCKKDRMQGDHRNYLYIQYAKFLERYKPKYFVFENVMGLLSARDASGILYFDRMLALFNSIGYSVEYEVLSSENHGVPQSRKRVIIIGKLGENLKGFYPNFEKNSVPILIKELFHDLPKLKNGEGLISTTTLGQAHQWLYDNEIRNNQVPVTFHQARKNNAQDLEIYKIATQLWTKKKKRLEYNELPERLKTHKQRLSFLDRFKVVAPDLHYSHTIVAHIAKDGHYYIHPDINQNRSITPREAARIQTFPDDYFFESASGKPSRTAAFKQIGNAVPVLLAKQIANKVKEIWYDD